LDRCQFVRLGTEKVPMTPALKAEINKQCKFYGTGAFVRLSEQTVGQWVSGSWVMGQIGHQM